jgi:hydroxymethylglutaryl-CoA lyase
LQNESTILSVEQRMSLLQRLIAAGIKTFEVGAFVSPRWVPQMAQTEELTKKYSTFANKNKSSVDLNPSILVPNLIGFGKVLNTDIKEIAIFISATETFSQKNINCSIIESLQRAQEVILAAKKNKIKVRGYLSVCFGCPYEGDVSEGRVVKLVGQLFKMGCYEVSIGDTIGVAHPGQVKSLFTKLKRKFSVKKIAGHFHDTRGQSLANILTALQLGFRVFDSSIGGLGGCPYAKGSSGNVSTEDVVYMLHGLGYDTGIDVEQLIQTNHWLAPQINHALPSKVGKVGLLKV